MRPTVVCCSVALAISIGSAHASPADRPLSTDRPDRTESPYTVPAGWIQVESDLFSWSLMESSREQVTALSAMSFNAKYGVTRRIDLQFLFSPWTRVESEVSGLQTYESSGTGEAGLRVKVNLAGNDSGRSACGVIPYAFVPTRGDSIFEAITWGMVIPVAIDLGGDRGLSAMAGFSRVDNADTWLIGSFSFSTPIAGELAGFAEVYVASSGSGEDSVDDTTFDVGVTYAPRPDWQLDAAVYRGVTTTSEDWRVFVGASVRFDLSPP